MRGRRRSSLRNPSKTLHRRKEAAAGLTLLCRVINLIAFDPQTTRIKFNLIECNLGERMNGFCGFDWMRCQVVWLQDDHELFPAVGIA